MWANPQKSADLVTFTEEILMENFIFCAGLRPLWDRKLVKIKAISLTKIMMVFYYWLWTLSFLSIWVRSMDGNAGCTQNVGMLGCTQLIGMLGCTQKVGMLGCTQLIWKLGVPSEPWMTLNFVIKKLCEGKVQYLSYFPAVIICSPFR